jgi:uncharacterized protein YcfJ
MEYAMTPIQRNAIIGAAAIAVIAGTAIASSYITSTSLDTGPTPQQQAAVHHSGQRYAAAAPAAGQPAPVRRTCDDHNIVGTVGGAVAGGLVGSAFGKGSGRGLATAGGAVAGGALGNAYIPTRGATCD